MREHRAERPQPKAPSPVLVQGTRAHTWAGTIGTPVQEPGFISTFWCFFSNRMIIL